MRGTPKCLTLLRWDNFVRQSETMSKRCFILLVSGCLLVCFSGIGQVFYTNAFISGAGPEWSLNRVGGALARSMKFLGPLGNILSRLEEQRSQLGEAFPPNGKLVTAFGAVKGVLDIVAVQ